MISHSSDLSSEYLRGSRYWLPVTPKYHIVPLLKVIHWIWRLVHNMNHAHGPSKSEFLTDIFLPHVFYLMKTFFPSFKNVFFTLSSSIHLWDSNPSRGNGGLLLHFTVHHSWKIMVWNSPRPPPPQPCTRLGKYGEEPGLPAGEICWLLIALRPSGVDFPSELTC